MIPLRAAGPGALVVLLLLLAGLALWSLRRRLTAFSLEALALLRSRHPDIDVVRKTPGGAILRVAGMEVRVDLASLYRRWGGRVQPDAVDRLAGEVRAGLPPLHSPALTRAQPHLLPLIKPQAFVEVYDRYPPAFHLVARRFAGDLAVVYVSEGFHQITYVTVGMRAAWELPADDLHVIAVANLRRRTAHLLAELGGPREVYEHLDGFEAARILTPDLITPPGLAPAVAAIPHEHLLLVAGSGDAPRLAVRAEAAHKRARYPLSPAVFQLGEASFAPPVLS
ncbi:MAG: hypothetical protein ACREKB_13980 [Candidatus Rokuibacteriota bacterium]